jgi:PAS domain S-box-containing protein
VNPNTNFEAGLSGQSFHNLMAQAPVALSVLRGCDLIIESANSIMLEVWGKQSDIINRPLIEGLPELAGQPFVALLQSVYTNGNSYYGNETKVALVRNGKTETCYFDFVYKPLTQDGTVTGVMVVATEVTGQVQARRKLQDAEERLRLATESTGLATWDLDLQNKTIIYSPRLAEIFGYSRDAVLQHSHLRDIVHPNDLHIVLKAFDKAIETGVYYYEARVLWADGSIHWIRTTGKIFYDENKVPLRMLGTLIDITDQHNIIDRLKEREESLRMAANAAELGTFDMEVASRISVWNKRHRELFGVLGDEPVDYNEVFWAAMHPDDKQKINKAIDFAFNKKLSNGDYDVEYRTIGIEDGKLRWIRAKGKVLFNEQDEPVRLIGAVLDITESKQNEIRKNDFIAMASHELKTPLTSVKAYIQLLLAKAKNNGDGFMINALEKSENQIKKMTNLIYGFLDLSKLESGRLRLNADVFDIGKLIEEVAADSRPISQGHHIIYHEKEPVIIKADREKIGQVISNLINNAVKYSPKNMDVTITLSQTEDNIKVAVTDNGIGVKLKDQDKIFQRFYRVEDESTKGFSGFGIGLYLSAEIIHLHNGTIGVDSNDSKGSTFYFTLPHQSNKQS